MNEADPIVTAYLRKIGSKGGRTSRRALGTDSARRMVAVREARRAFRTFKTECFWSFDPDWQIGVDEIPLVIRTLKHEGGHRAFEKARSLERMLEV